MPCSPSLLLRQSEIMPCSPITTEAVRDHDLFPLITTEAVRDDALFPLITTEAVRDHAVFPLITTEAVRDHALFPLITTEAVRDLSCLPPITTEAVRDHACETCPTPPYLAEIIPAPPPPPPPPYTPRMSPPPLLPRFMPCSPQHTSRDHALFPSLLLRQSEIMPCSPHTTEAVRDHALFPPITTEAVRDHARSPPITTEAVRDHALFPPLLLRQSEIMPCSPPITMRQSEIIPCLPPITTEAVRDHALFPPLLLRQSEIIPVPPLTTSEIMPSTTEAQGEWCEPITLRPPNEATSSTPVQYWQHHPEKLIFQSCDYEAYYLGSMLVKELRGTESTQDACSKMRKSTEQMKKVPTIVLSVSYKGVKFIDATNKNIIAEHEIRNISCAAQDPEDLSTFAYITKDLKSSHHYCHVFTAFDVLALQARKSGHGSSTLPESFDIKPNKPVPKPRVNIRKSMEQPSMEQKGHANVPWILEPGQEAKRGANTKYETTIF
ncbi:unnamed protein product [Coregonus sp. 'balchen']|nr:unnamed protein product [Coregonus sp. 'balchen']